MRWQDEKYAFNSHTSWAAAFHRNLSGEMKLLGANGTIDMNKWFNISRDLGGVKKEWQELQALTYQEKKESKSA